MDCGAAWSDLTDYYVILWPNGTLGPGPMAPTKRGPRAKGPIVARSMEIGAPPHAPPERPWRNTGMRAPLRAGSLAACSLAACSLAACSLRRAPCGVLFLWRAPLRRAPCGRAYLRPLRNAPRAAAAMPRIRWARMRQGGLQRNRRFKIDHFRDLRNCDDVTYSAQGTSQCNPGMLVRRT